MAFKIIRDAQPTEIPLTGLVCREFKDNDGVVKTVWIDHRKQVAYIFKQPEYIIKEKKRNTKIQLEERNDERINYD